MRLLSRLLVTLLLLPIITPILGSFGIKSGYAYASETLTVSDSASVQFGREMGSFVVVVESGWLSLGEDDLSIQLSINGVTKTTGLEIAGDETGMYFTAPQHFAPSNTLSLECRDRDGELCSRSKLFPGLTLHIEWLDTRTRVRSLVWDPEYSLARVHAVDSARLPGLDIITRAEWGADESLRYEENPLWVKFRAKQAANASSTGVTVSNATLKIRAKNSAIEARLRSTYPEEYERAEVIRKEGDKTLVWPIEKYRTIRKIVLHHTAEENTKELSDPELMRSMYYYHTVVRGWGDYGYHYVIGQRGQIYEGRAWGDYAGGAHAGWNNASTVGVSVVGNFENTVLVREQKKAVFALTSALARKYGIDISKELMGHKACKVDQECITTDALTSGIVGHRDVGFTSCPGKNLYTVLTDELRPALESETRGYTPVINPVFRPATLGTIAPRETITQTTKWPNIRIKLSVPDLARLDLEVIEWVPLLEFGKTRGMISTGSLSFGVSRGQVQMTLLGKRYRGPIVSLAGTLVRVNNWDRKPSWDKSGLLNDNVFRGKLEARIEGGKLILINELPLEDYLAGIAEISNGDPTEKVRTIIVAARSYALYYTGRDRKFAGKPYDGSDDPDVFQKYLGYGYEKRSPTTLENVRATTGQVIKLSGTIIKPWYFNQSTGRTLSALEYCEGRKSRGEISSTATCKDIPYLQSVADPGSEGREQRGHGVGISGAGATYYAGLGWTHEQIIEYYLTGVKVEAGY